MKLIASVNRHESPELAEQVAWLAAERKDDGVVGMDLAGNEAEFKSEPFYGVFREARQAGLHITIHAGEWGPAANVQEAIEAVGRGTDRSRRTRAWRTTPSLRLPGNAARHLKCV